GAGWKKLVKIRIDGRLGDFMDRAPYGTEPIAYAWTDVAHKPAATRQYFATFTVNAGDSTVHTLQAVAKNYDSLDADYTFALVRLTPDGTPVILPFNQLERDRLYGAKITYTVETYDDAGRLAGTDERSFLQYRFVSVVNPENAKPSGAFKLRSGNSPVFYPTL